MLTNITDQPPPITNAHPAVWDLVIADMQSRDHTGRERYGTPLQPHNGRDALVDAYQETLDQAVYLRQEIAEREDLRAEIARLRALNESLCERIAGQAEVLARRAEKVPGT